MFYRFGHPHFNIVELVINIMNKTLKLASDIDICNVCQLEKSHCLSLKHVPSLSTVPFEIIHMDFWGPSYVVFILRMKYFLLFIDSRTRYHWIYILNQKSHVQFFLYFDYLILR